MVICKLRQHSYSHSIAERKVRIFLKEILLMDINIDFALFNTSGNHTAITIGSYNVEGVIY